jgi:hypothetical protein
MTSIKMMAQIHHIWTRYLEKVPGFPCSDFQLAFGYIVMTLVSAIESHSAAARPALRFEPDVGMKTKFDAA